MSNVEHDAVFWMWLAIHLFTPILAVVAGALQGAAGEQHWHFVESPGKAPVNRKAAQLCVLRHLNHTNTKRDSDPVFTWSVFHSTISCAAKVPKRFMSQARIFRLPCAS